MELRVKELSKMLGFKGTGAELARLAGPLAAAQATPTATAAEKIGPTNWPFEEIRIPFRERKGKVKLPNNAKLAVYFYITADWPDSWNGPTSLYRPALAGIGNTSRYNFNVALYRALELVEKHGIKVSCFPDGDVVSAYPELIKQFHELGHEITARSLTESQSPIMLTPEREEAIARQVTDTIAQIVGEHPVGWMSPGAKCTNQTPEILANLGYLWWGDLCGDDVPYGIRSVGKVIVAVPYRPATTVDFAIFSNRVSWFEPTGRDPETAFTYFRNTFDAYYWNATTEGPTMMLYGIHPWISCLPDRVWFHDKAMIYMKGFKDIWFARYRDVAQWWKENYL